MLHIFLIRYVFDVIAEPKCFFHKFQSLVDNLIALTTDGFFLFYKMSKYFIVIISLWLLCGTVQPMFRSSSKQDKTQSPQSPGYFTTGIKNASQAVKT